MSQAAILPDAEVTEIHARVKTPEKLGLSVTPFHRKTDGQQNFDQHFKDNKYILGAIGYAGTGKTSLSLHLALEKLLNKNSDINHIKIVRTLVPVRDIGFLKGSVEEKQEPFNIYRDMVNTICNDLTAWSRLIDNGFISFIGTTHEQGKSYHNTVVILDEAQNFTFQELDLITTRLSVGSRLMFCADTQQDYLKKSERSGLRTYMEIISKLRVGAYVEYSANDIVRSDLVRDYICMKMNHLHGDPLPDNYNKQTDYFTV